MTLALPTPPATRLRRRSIWAVFALLGALLATGAAAPASADVFTDGPGTISGTFTDGNGQPVAYGFVYAAIDSGGEGTPWGAGISADADGHFEFVGIPLGNYFLQASAATYQNPPTQFATLTEAAPTATVNFTVLPFEIGVGTISGHVTLDGAPVAFSFVSTNNFASGQSFNVTTDGNGYYEFTGLTNGEWNVSSYVPGAQPLFQSPVTISASTPTVTVNMPFLSYPVGTASISGTATNAETGEPLAGLCIHLYGIDVAQSTGASTDGAGAYSLGNLPAGTYQLGTGIFGYLGVDLQVHVAEGEALVVDLALIPADSTISGHIVGPNGQPAANVSVSAYATAGGSGNGTSTDANGDYVLDNLGPLQYTVSVGGPGTPYEPQSKVVTAVAHGDVTANFTVSPRTTGFIAGGVFDESGIWFYDQPVCATLYSSKSKKPLASMVTYGEDFGDGTWSFDKLKPGSYTVEFRDCDDDPSTKFDKVFLGGVKNIKDATFITIAAGQDSYDNNVTLTVRSNNGHH